MKCVVSFVALLAALTASAAGAAPATHRLVVIVNRNETVSDISFDDLRRIYVGRMTRFPDRRRVTPVILGSTEPAEQYFLKRIVGMAEVDFAQLWIGQVFRGEVAATPHLSVSAAEAKQFVDRHPHSIAFIEADDLDASVKALTVDGKRFDAAGYPFAW
jgi:hypothetical protein